MTIVSAVTIKYNGLMCNKILQYLMGQYIAEKYNLVFENSLPEELGLNEIFKVKKYSGNNSYSNVELLCDANQVSFLSRDSVNSNVYLDGFFQEPSILKNPELISKYKEYLKPINNEKIDDVFVHVRLGDVYNSGMHLPYEYYNNTLEKINFDSGVVASDSLDNDIVKKPSK